MKQKEILGRIKVTQHFVVWTSIFLVFLYLILPKTNYNILKLLSVFIIGFTYTLSGFYFIKLGGYVGQDIGQFFSKFYKKHNVGIKKTLVVVGYLLGILIVGIGIYLIMVIPENYKLDRLIAISGIVVAIILYLRSNRKNN